MEAAASLMGRALSVDVIAPEEHPLEKVFGRQGGERIDADLVVVCIGVEPRLQLAEAAGLALDRGVLVDSRLQTSDPDIFAAGDIARSPDTHTGESIRAEHSPSARARSRPRTC
jgi:NADPH-dependent 2,4-dienoyl-CoA reductase/sulfur reductase-like enzyme